MVSIIRKQSMIALALALDVVQEIGVSRAPLLSVKTTTGHCSKTSPQTWKAHRIATSSHSKTTSFRSDKKSAGTTSEMNEIFAPSGPTRTAPRPAFLPESEGSKEASANTKNVGLSPALRTLGLPRGQGRD